MNNSRQNPLQVLNAQSKQSWSGCIEVAEPKDPSISWHIYLLEGKIQYINTTARQQTRLNYLWQQFKLGSQCPRLSNDKNVSEYSQLCQWLSDKQLADEEIKKVLFMFVKEGLTQVLSIQYTNVELKPARRIKKSLVNFRLSKINSDEQIKKNIKAWIEIKKYLSSPTSRLYLEQKNALKFYKIWKTLYADPDLAVLANSQKLSSFVSLFVTKSNLYEIATKVKVDTYFLAKYLKQSIEEDIVDILPCSEFTSIEATSNQEQANNNQAKSDEPQRTDSSQSSSNLVVCIDDSKTVQRQVKMTLEAAGYKVMSILDPTLALKDLSKQQPAVIFLDINMPNMNGYDLCTILRKSKKFKDIPIVMLTGRDGMIDRVRAKLAGATDYLTKPCDPNKLIQLTQVLEKTVVTA